VQAANSLPQHCDSGNKARQSTAHRQRCVMTAGCGPVQIVVNAYLDLFRASLEIAESSDP
jgi:hypothetical protein